MPKISVRLEMLTQRKQLAIGTCLAWSLRIQETFLRLPEFLAASCLALYSPICNEVYTEEIFRAARQSGKTVALPRVIRENLEFVEVTAREELAPGAFGILEPTAGRVIPIRELDLLAVPGVAFDLAGHRLGYGKGFYDRVLHDPARHCLLAGLCFEQQIVTVLPAEAHDMPMDLLITEERTLRFDHRSGGAVQKKYTYGGGPGH